MTNQTRLSPLVLSQLRAIVGESAVLDRDSVSDHTDPYSFLGKDTVSPVAVVRPGSLSEVQAVVRLAGAEGLKLWTVSTGRNYAYGGASPKSAGCLVVDLSRMNRVISVDETNAFAVVEPGVTFMQFAEHLRTHAPGLMPSVPDIGWGSLIGNALERGFGYAAHSDHSQYLCGLEVVLPNGDVIHTGMGAKADSPAAHLYKGGFGPSLDGLFYQSNLGIVTRAGIWLTPRPEWTAVFKVGTANEDGLGPLVDALHQLLLDGTIQSNAIVGNTVIIAATLGNREDFCGPDALVGPAEIRAMMDKFHIGWWNAGFAVYGNKAMVSARVETVKNALSKLPDARYAVREYHSSHDPASVHPADRAQLAIPSLDMVRIAGWRGGTPAHTDFSLVLPPNGKDTNMAMKAIREEVERAGFDYAGGFTLFPRHAIALALLAFDKDSQTQSEKVRALVPRLIARGAEQKAAPYRSHTAFMDLTADQYDADGYGLRKLTEQIKTALDPDGILSDGKQGIFSRHL